MPIIMSSVLHQKALALLRGATVFIEKSIFEQQLMNALDRVIGKAQSLS